MSVHPLRRPIPKAPVGEPALTRRELATVLGLSESSLDARRAADPANFPVHRWGARLLRFYESEVRAYLDVERSVA